jgi:DNA (cytosine-5)-methyltransferase 1
MERQGGMRIWVERSAGHPFPNDRKVDGVAHSFVDCSRTPAPTIVADRQIHFFTEPCESGQMENASKPPYRVPLMSEIAPLPWNGYSVASLFAGCGGSSTGYRMAGFRVLYVNEFIEAARNTYRANAKEGTVIDGRDIREVAPEDILNATGLGVGDIDVLDGSPPCASFSTAGKRHRHWGEERAYSDKVQRTDDLFFEFARILAGVKPKVFVAENVSGLVKGTAKGYFLEILAALKGCGYKVSAKLLDAQWLGVPQARQRLIFVGVREDLDNLPAHPKPLSFRYSIRDALPELGRVIYGTKYAGFAKRGTEVDQDRPCPTVLAGNFETGPFQFAIEPEADISRYAVGAEWDKLGPGGQSERYFQLVKPDADEPSPTITASGGTTSLASVTHPTERRKFSIAELRRICGFPDDFVLTGTYAQQWERLGRAVPPVMMRAIAETIRDEILSKVKR